MEGWEGVVWLKFSVAGANEPRDASVAWAGTSGQGDTPPRSALVAGPPC